MAPHDEDDDVDDLDEILNKFKPTPQKPDGASSASGTTQPQATTTSQQNPTSPPPPPPPHTGSGDADLTNDAFAEELAQGMENLMKGLGADLGYTGDADPAEQQKAMQAAWEALFEESMKAAAESDGVSSTSTAGAASGAAAAPGTGTKAGDSYQKSIRETMERMKNSEQSMKDDVGGGTDDFASLLAALQGDSEGPEDEAELASFLETMMDQLMSKEILYDPLKELHDKFPEYLASHPPQSSTASPADPPSDKKLTPIPPEDHARYIAQQKLIATVITKFDSPKYDETAKTPEAEQSRKEIAELVAELQTLGTPPDELMGPLPAGLGLGAEGMPEGCSIA